MTDFEINQINDTRAYALSVIEEQKKINNTLKKSLYNTSFYLPLGSLIYGSMCVIGGAPVVISCVGGALIGAGTLIRNQRERLNEYVEYPRMIGLVDHQSASTIQTLNNSNTHLNNKLDDMVIYAPPVMLGYGALSIRGRMPIVIGTFIGSMIGLGIYHSKLIKTFYKTKN